MKSFKQFLLRNPLAGLRTSPFRVPLVSWVPLIVYTLIALPAGFLGGLFTPQLINAPMPLMAALPVTLFIFPSLLEELVFRGLLIPRDVLKLGFPSAFRAVLLSTALFVAWHPIGALTVNPASREFFLDPLFLIITAALGLACGFGYVLSGSLWVPVIFHWLTVLIWVFLLGGRNMVLD